MASALTLTDFIPVMYEGLDIISRERVGFINACSINASAERLAVNQTARIDVVPAATAEDITPATTAPDTGAQTIGKEDMSITKSRMVPIPWSGEEEKQVSQSTGAVSIRAKQFAQAVRTLTNEVELDLATEARINASRAYGTAATTPFASGVGDTAQLRKILDDNGAPVGDLQLVVSTAAAALLRTNTQLTKANEAATESTLRRGELVDLHDFSIRQSGQLGIITKGGGTSYVTDGTYAIGDTAITVDTGSGTVLAGDVITFTGDTNKYVVKTGIAAPGVVTLAEPGLRKTLGDGVALTIGGDFTPNVAFDRNALQLLARQPALPASGDAAADRMEFMDPVSGIVFEVSLYGEFRRVRYTLGLSWGVAGIKREHTALLLG